MWFALPAVPDVYRAQGYGEWEDEVWAEFASSWNSGGRDKVHALLGEMFEEHNDIHDLLCYFLRGLGRRRPTNKKHALYKTLLEQFQKWKEEREGDLPK